MKKRILIRLYLIIWLTLTVASLITDLDIMYIVSVIFAFIGGIAVDRINKKGV